MKKSKKIQLILITAALASCNKPTKDWGDEDSKTYIRSDSSAPYSRTHYHGSNAASLWYYAFRPYGYYSNGHYQRVGYYSDAIHASSNTGSNAFKSGIVRGGFGRGGFSVSS